MKNLNMNKGRRDAAPPSTRFVQLASAEPVQGAAASSRVRSFVASNGTVDSHNTTFRASGWVLERFNRNPVVPLFHNYRDFPVGKGRAYVAGDELRLDVEFAPADDPVSGPHAEQALLWVDRGVLGVSVGFDWRTAEYEYNKERETGDEMTDWFFPPLDYVRQELHEVSIVTIPSNPDALPVGRDALRFARPEALNEMRAMLEERRARAQVKASQKVTFSVDEVRRLVGEIATEEVNAARARRTGKLNGGNQRG